MLGQTWLLIENTAGGGATIGRSVDELATIVDRMDGTRASAYASTRATCTRSGYDITDRDELDRLLEEVDEKIGLDRLRCLHINDSKAPLGSNRDRHDGVLAGLMGERLGVFVGHPSLQGLPAVIETGRRRPRPRGRRRHGCCASYMPAGREGRRADLREHAEGGLAHRQLGELGIHASELALRGARSTTTTSARHIGSGRRVARTRRSPHASARLPSSRSQVDLALVDLLHAAEVRVAELLVRVDERALPLEARGRVHDLVAVDVAAAALSLVLRPKRKVSGAMGSCRMLRLWPYDTSAARLDFGVEFRHRGGFDGERPAPDRVAAWDADSSGPRSRSGPLVILLHYLDRHRRRGEFVLAALALIPLAWLIGEATEHASHHTGPGIGGFLNATFGNAPELIIALIAVNEGLTEVVRGSLTGSVVGNLLLVLGFSLALGGRGRSTAVELHVARARALAVVAVPHPVDPRLGR